MNYQIPPLRRAILDNTMHTPHSVARAGPLTRLSALVLVVFAALPSTAGSAL